MNVKKRQVLVIIFGETGFEPGEAYDRDSLGVDIDNAERLGDRDNQ